MYPKQHYKMRPAIVIDPALTASQPEFLTA